MPRSIDAHRSDCPCPACRSRQGLAVPAAERGSGLHVILPPDVDAWIRARPEGATAAIVTLVRGEVRKMGPTCQSCAEAGVVTPATTRSSNPEFSGYELCDECAAEYDARA